MTVFRASTNCPTDGLFLDPQCKRIAPNGFSSASWFRFQVLRYLNFFSLNLLYTCWTAATVISHQICEGGGWICSHSLLRKVQLFILPAVLPVLQVLTCTAWSATQNLTMVMVACDTTEAVEEAINFLHKRSCWQTPVVHVTCNYIGTMRVTYMTTESHKRK